MSTRSAKHRQFVREPMDGKPVEDVPGVGDVVGDNMRQDGIRTARKLYGYYLSNPDTFKDRVMSYGANSGQQQAAYAAMRDYSNQHD